MPKKLMMMTATIGLLLFLAISCEENKSQSTSLPNGAVNSLRIGLIPEHDLFSQTKRYEPLAHYLSEQLQTRVELKILSRYGNIIDNFVSEELDGAFFGSFTGAMAIRKLGVVPIARPEYLDGRSTYYGMIIVRKDSGIKAVKDMKGRRFAFVDKATTAGWLLPLHYFRELGIEEYRDWFSETYFTGTHEDVFFDVLDGRAEMGAAKNTVYERLAAKNSRLREELEVLAVSPEVPANGLAVRRDLDEGARERLRQVLLKMDENPEGQKVLQDFGAIQFLETTVEDYQPVFKFAEHVGIDLADYDYLNQ